MKEDNPGQNNTKGDNSWVVINYAGKIFWDFTHSSSFLYKQSTSWLKDICTVELC